MGRTGTGVEARERSIRVQFVYEGRTIKERLTVAGKALAPTPANLKYAARVAAEIKRRVALGTFTFAEFFPDSKRIPATEVTTFGKLAKLWVESKGNLAASTRDQYANAANMWVRMLGEDTPIRDLTHATLAAKIGGTPWASAKSANNYLIALRGILALEYRGPRALENPMIGIDNLSMVKKPPDPLTTDERDQILKALATRDERVYAYFLFAFSTGMRPEEQIALQWGDVDWQRETVMVQRVRTFRGSERDGSKTHTVREVDLVGPALAALRIMQPYTTLKRDDVGRPADIFENPVTGRPWHDERSQRDHYWAPTLKRLGIRSRRAYGTRHTYATAALMAGVNPAYIAQQLGNSVKILLERYARWIPQGDNGRARQAMNEALGSGFVPLASQNRKENF